jgi:hypothetical protein
MKEEGINNVPLHIKEVIQKNMNDLIPMKWNKLDIQD